MEVLSSKNSVIHHKMISLLLLLANALAQNTTTESTAPTTTETLVTMPPTNATTAANTTTTTNNNATLPNTFNATGFDYAATATTDVLSVLGSDIDSESKFTLRDYVLIAPVCFISGLRFVLVV